MKGDLKMVDRILEIDLSSPQPMPTGRQGPPEGERVYFQIEILSPIVRGRKGEYSALLLEMFRRGFSKATVNGEKYDLSPKTKINLERYKKHTIDIMDVSLNRVFYYMWWLKL